MFVFVFILKFVTVVASTGAYLLQATSSTCIATLVARPEPEESIFSYCDEPA